GGTRTGSSEARRGRRRQQTSQEETGEEGSQEKSREKETRKESGQEEAGEKGGKEETGKKGGKEKRQEKEAPLKKLASGTKCPRAAVHAAAFSIPDRSEFLNSPLQACGPARTRPSIVAGGEDRDEGAPRHACGVLPDLCLIPPCVEWSALREALRQARCRQRQHDPGHAGDHHADAHQRPDRPHRARRPVHVDHRAQGQSDDRVDQDPESSVDRARSPPQHEVEHALNHKQKHKYKRQSGHAQQWAKQEVTPDKDVRQPPESLPPQGLSTVRLEGKGNVNNAHQQ